MYEKSAGIEVSDMTIEDIVDTDPPPPPLPEPEVLKKPHNPARRGSVKPHRHKHHTSHQQKHPHSHPQQKTHSAQTETHAPTHTQTYITNGNFDINENDVDADNVDAASNASSVNKKSLYMNIWDFCGHPFYLFPHYMFFEQPAIAILTFNMHAYRAEHFDEMISSWFDWMIAKTNKICVLLVGTHADKLNKTKIKSVGVET